VTKTKTEPTLPADIQAKLDAVAADRNLTVAEVVEQALRDWLYDIEAGRRPRT